MWIKRKKENDRLLILSDVGCVQIGTDFETSFEGQTSDDAAVRSQTVENAGKFISHLVHLLIRFSQKATTHWNKLLLCTFCRLNTWVDSGENLT